MAKRTTVYLEDDFDGGAADETITFGLDGRAYEIDLSAKNAAKFRNVLATYVKAGRRVGKASAVRPGLPVKPSGRDEDVAAMRAWARQAGYTVRDRGRISAIVRTAYHSSR